MSKNNSSVATDIPWARVNAAARNRNKTSGLKIEYSISDELDFVRKLAIQIRKKLMRELFERENATFQQELTRMGLLYTHDTICEDIKTCGREQGNK